MEQSNAALEFSDDTYLVFTSRKRCEATVREAPEMALGYVEIESLISDASVGVVQVATFGERVDVQT